MPDQKDPTANRRATGSERHPLREPLRKVVHAIQDGGIHLLELTNVCILGAILCPHSLRLSVIESLVENAMGWREGLHR
jgi:hypothetical protein